MENKCLLCGQNCRPQLSLLDICLLVNQQSQICQTCNAQFEKIPEKHCPRCCKAGEEIICNDCLVWSECGVEVSHRALYRYNLAMKDYFSKYKFQGDYILKSLFSSELKKYLEKYYHSYTKVVVPVSQSRLEERTFNQVSSVLDDANIPYIDIIQKKEGKKQSEKNRKQRIASENPFYIFQSENLPERIVIIDDIYTTGTTISQIRQLLSEQGIKDIKSLSIAR